MEDTPEAEQNRRSEDGSKLAPVIAIDYAFIDKYDGALMSRRETTVLTFEGGRSGAVKPIPVPQKDIDREEYATRTVMNFLRWLGGSDIVIKTDGGPAIVKVANHVAQHRCSMTKTPPEEDSRGRPPGQRHDQELQQNH